MATRLKRVTKLPRAKSWASFLRILPRQVSSSSFLLGETAWRLSGHQRNAAPMSSPSVPSTANLRWMGNPLVTNLPRTFWSLPTLSLVMSLETLFLETLSLERLALPTKLLVMLCLVMLFLVALLLASQAKPVAALSLLRHTSVVSRRTCEAPTRP